MINESAIDMNEFQALRNFQHADKANKNRFINFFRNHIDNKQRICTSCWDQINMIRAQVHKAYDEHFVRLQKLHAGLEEPQPYSNEWLQAKQDEHKKAVDDQLEQYKNQKPETDVPSA